jgi:hypothetical protein
MGAPFSPQDTPRIFSSCPIPPSMTSNDFILGGHLDVFLFSTTSAGPSCRQLGHPFEMATEHFARWFKEAGSGRSTVSGQDALRFFQRCSLAQEQLHQVRALWGRRRARVSHLHLALRSLVVQGGVWHRVRTAPIPGGSKPRRDETVRVRRRGEAARASMTGWLSCPHGRWTIVPRLVRTSSGPPAFPPLAVPGCLG